ncbi:MAG TPA: glycosyltransferase [Bacteroidota bacterium]|nr:glycosyltransferase [Bacteroidota bacterium]
MNTQAPFQMRLGVIGAPPHWSGPDGALRAFEPYVREMRVWADLFRDVVICAHAGEGPMRGNLAPYERENIEIRQVRYTTDHGFSGARRRLVQLPGLTLSARRTISDTDFALLRSPSHFGLVGIVLVRLMGRGSITKWAGGYGAFRGERIPTRVNRWLESLVGKNHVTLVYGEAHRAHHESFIPALMTSREIADAREAGKPRRWAPPWQILCVGRLELVKNFDLVLRALGELRVSAPALDWRFTMVGGGREEQNLRTLARECAIADRVTFTGPLSFSDVQKRYGAAHVVIMPGVQEGWPKVIAEAWAHGAFPLGARGGIVPWILSDAGSGAVFEATPASLAGTIAGLLADPGRLASISEGLYSRAEAMSLDQFRARLERVLAERCGLPRDGAL